MKKITEKEFLKAVSIVKQYQKQINEMSEIVSKKKTSIHDWLDNLNKPISTRLKQALLIHAGHGNFNFIEDFERFNAKEEFLKIRNVGKHTFKELCGLIEINKSKY